jgi:hypothetical protein
MSRFDYVSEFYNVRHAPIDFVNEVSSLLSAEYLDARIIPFGCEYESIDWFAGISTKNRKVELVWKIERLSFFRLSYTYRDKGEINNKQGYFFILQDENFSNVFIAITIEKSDFYRRALLPLIKSLYPRILMTFITHKKLRHLLERFQGEGDFDNLVITRASQRLRFQLDNQGRRSMPIVSWPEMTLSQAFDWVYEHNGWFESLSFDAIKLHRVEANISFTRQGIIKTNAILKRVINSFINPVCKTIHDNLELFSHRARLERSDLSPRPLLIDFDEDQFVDVEENRRFITAMKRLRTASVSVLHGNPYVHLSILDYYDGSAFDLWILDNRQIVLVPQLKGSVASIKRLINHIFDDYAEGRLANYYKKEKNDPA